MIVKSLMKKVARQLEIEFKETISEVSHNLSAGMAREESIKDLLKKYLPKRAEVDSGFVIDASGATSLQIDIIIYDSSYGSHYDVGGVKYFPCEIVLAVGEIKTGLNDSSTFSDALNKIKSVKALDRSNKGRNQLLTGPGISLTGLIPFDPNANHRDQILGFIFSGSGMHPEKMIERMQDFNLANKRQVWTNLICVLSHYLISYEIEKSLSPSPMEAKFLYFTKEEEKEEVLLTFLNILSNHIAIAHIATPNFHEYGNMSDSKCEYRSLLPENSRSK